MLAPDGATIRPAGTHKLCRCGQSSTKPFCDDTRKRITWSDAKHEARVEDKQIEYPGTKATVLDNRGVCSHAGFCTDLLPSVFKGGTKPWMDPDGATPDELAAVIRRCPSGALAYRLGGTTHQAFGVPPAIVAAAGGPLRVSGSPEFKNPSGNRPETTDHFALCRCGNSKNKPFCDGTHWYVNFGHRGPATNNLEEETAGYVELGGPDEYEEGRPTVLAVGATELAVFKIWGRVCAVANEFGREGPMSQATVKGGKILGASGRAYTPYPWKREPEDNLPVHDVMIVDGRVFVAEKPAA